jgi:hypothetical protein
VIFSIASVDFPESWTTAVQEIEQRLNSGQEQLLISGLISLKRIFQAHQYAEKNGDNKILNSLVERFFPLLESLLLQIQQSSSSNQITLYHLIAKIFCSSNEVNNT